MVKHSHPLKATSTFPHLVINNEMIIIKLNSNMMPQLSKSRLKENSVILMFNLTKSIKGVNNQIVEL